MAFNSTNIFDIPGISGDVDSHFMCIPLQQLRQLPRISITIPVPNILDNVDLLL